MPKLKSKSKKAKVLWYFREFNAKIRAKFTCIKKYKCPLLANMLAQNLSECVYAVAGGLPKRSCIDFW